MSMVTKFAAVRNLGAVAICLVMAGPVLAGDVSADTIVATVNGTEITLGHMAALRESLPQEYQALPDDVLFNGILEQLIQQTALSQVAESTMTKRDELILQNERRGYLAGVVLDATATGAVTEEALKAAYDAKYANAEPGKEYNASHILVATEEEAKAIKAKIDGGADFAEVAKSQSSGTSGANGGDLGWFGLGMMVEPFEKAVVALEPGKVSEPVQTQFGWHIIKLNETRVAEAPKLEDVRDQLAADIQEKAVSERVSAVTTAATIERKAEGIDPAVLKDATILSK